MRRSGKYISKALDRIGRGKGMGGQEILHGLATFRGRPCLSDCNAGSEAVLVAEDGYASGKTEGQNSKIEKWNHPQLDSPTLYASGDRFGIWYHGLRGDLDMRDGTR